MSDTPQPVSPSFPELCVCFSTRHKAGFLLLGQEGQDTERIPHVCFTNQYFNYLKKLLWKDSHAGYDDLYYPLQFLRSCELGVFRLTSGREMEAQRTVLSGVALEVGAQPGRTGSSDPKVGAPSIIPFAHALTSLQLRHSKENI